MNRTWGSTEMNMNELIFSCICIFLCEVKVHSCVTVAPMMLDFFHVGSGTTTMAGIHIAHEWRRNPTRLGRFFARITDVACPCWWTRLILRWYFREWRNESTRIPSKGHSLRKSGTHGDSNRTTLHSVFFESLLYRAINRSECPFDRLVGVAAAEALYVIVCYVLGWGVICSRTDF